MSLRPSLLWFGLCLLSLPAASNEPIATAPAATQALPPARALDRTAMEKAIAGTVVAGLAERFGGRAVEVKFGDLSVEPLDARQRLIRGEGGLRFPGETGWIGFRFVSRYDDFLGQAGWPELEVGVGGDGRAIPNDSLALRQLEDRMADTLQREMGIASVRMQLDRVETIEMAGHYLGMDARGLADFGRDGSSDVRIRALYDRRDGQWLQMDYQLGPDAPMVAGVGAP
ncbi:MULTISPECIES: hypothetical protein [unclassified Lysobacter]|uniref:hypothetical protein n=1 Tax=unclassified Lysobacter TaxID=2635362 RepID=UPI001C21F346|nr:hypothetical protein [Lysobacter sp. MMG2]MBU8977918.1 hypothetical protein [Lysobacter sp. MMG2]